MKHSAIKPCHWQEQKLLTGRENRNCYKGYFGIESHLCIQNTPALPFCNHQCVFCWRDIENASFGSEWKGKYDEPKVLVNQMIRHSKNLIFEHITIKKSLENLDLMHQILYYIQTQITQQSNDPLQLQFTEIELTEALESTRNKIHRAMLVLKNTKILINPDEDFYYIHPRVVDRLTSKQLIDELIKEDVTTREDIERVFKEAEYPKHAAISLAGEPTLYPKIGELVNEFRKRGMCTFIVTNGTQPGVLRRLMENNQLPTQLYVSLPAPTKEAYLKICRPMERNGWEKIMETIALLPHLPCRTVVRITSVKYLNIDSEMVPDYVKIFKMGTPNFIDIKGFTVEAHALEMQNRFGGDHELREYAPSYDDLLAFAKEIERLGGYKIIETHEASRDILLRGNWPEEKSIKIDFSKV